MTAFRNRGRDFRNARHDTVGRVVDNRSRRPVTTQVVADAGGVRADAVAANRPPRQQQSIPSGTKSHGGSFFVLLFRSSSELDAESLCTPALFPPARTKARTKQSPRSFESTICTFGAGVAKVYQVHPHYTKTFSFISKINHF